MTRGGARAVAAAVAALTAIVTVPLLPGPAAAQIHGVRASGKVVIHGHGYGHGHGMSQYGAQGAGLAGKSYRRILHFYYPHTKLAEVGGPLRVLLSVGTSDVTVRPARRLRVRDLGDGKTWRVPTKARHARQWRIRPTLDRARVSSVQYRNASGWHRWNLPGHRKVLRGDGQFSAAGPVGLVLSDGSVRRYRGALRSASPYARATTRDVVNVVSFDQYIRGVLPAEMPSSWSAPALRAQAVAARSFAAWWRRAAGSRYWQVCDTTTCQVYAGVSAETKRTDAAVAATAGRILRYHGKPALTQFSASSGGWTSAGGLPYLPARADPWDDWAGNDYHSWRRRVGVASLENRYPGLGRLTAIRVSRREGHGMWGGRALRVVLRGSRDKVSLSGDDMRWALDLPSTWFSVDLTGARGG